MKATKELIDALMAVAFGNRDLESQRVRLNNLCIEADKETLELEAKAQELDRREKGCRVVYSHYEVLAYGTKDFYTCSECKQDVVIDGSDYCPSCGYRIDWKGESDNE